MTDWTQPHTWKPMDVPTLARMHANFRDNLLHLYEGISGGTQGTYTPTWKSSGTQPAIGDGTLTGRYATLGKLVIVDVYWACGPSTTYGTGNYSWTLPVSASNGNDALGWWAGYVSGVRSGFCWRFDADEFTIGSQAAGLATPTVPFTWNNGSWVAAQLMIWT